MSFNPYINYSQVQPSMGSINLPPMYRISTLPMMGPSFFNGSFPPGPTQAFGGLTQTAPAFPFGGATQAIGGFGGFPGLTQTAPPFSGYSTPTQSIGGYGQSYAPQQPQYTQSAYNASSPYGQNNGQQTVAGGQSPVSFRPVIVQNQCNVAPMGSGVLNSTMCINSGFNT